MSTRGKRPLLIPPGLRARWEEVAGLLRKAFDESQVRRHPKGSSKGGQFMAKEGGGDRREARGLMSDAVKAASGAFDFGWRGAPQIVHVAAISNPVTGGEIATSARADPYTHQVEVVGASTEADVGVMFHEFAHLSSAGRAFLDVPFYGMRKGSMVEGFTEIVARRALRRAGIDDGWYERYPWEVGAICLNIYAANGKRVAAAREVLDSILEVADGGDADALDDAIKQGMKPSLPLELNEWAAHLPEFFDEGKLNTKGREIIDRLSWGGDQ